MTARIDIAGLRWPRGMRRDDAAAYVGISPTKFDDWVERKIMPTPKKQDGVKVWDRLSLDLAFEALPDDTEDRDTWAYLTNGGAKIAAR